LLLRVALREFLQLVDALTDAWAFIRGRITISLLPV
jgi:hypothetical protein